MAEDEVDLLLSGMEDNQGQINYEGNLILLLFSVPSTFGTDCRLFSHLVQFICFVSCQSLFLAPHQGLGSGFNHLPPKANSSFSQISKYRLPAYVYNIPFKNY